MRAKYSEKLEQHVQFMDQNISYYLISYIEKTDNGLNVIFYDAKSDQNPITINVTKSSKKSIP